MMRGGPAGAPSPLQAAAAHLQLHQLHELVVQQAIPKGLVYQLFYLLQNLCHTHRVHVCVPSVSYAEACSCLQIVK
jgi:hypothetical protein